MYDGRGSVSAEISYNNAWYTFGGTLSRKTVTAKSYTPFGEQIGEATSGFGYNGEYYNAATGMIYLRARFYEPEMNRFAQKDIIRGSVFDPLGLNRYPYCANDPINFSDPSGMALRSNMVQVADSGGTFRTSQTYKNYLAEGQRLVNEAKQNMRQAEMAWHKAEAYAPGSQAAQAAMNAWKQAKSAAARASTNLSKLQSAGSLSAANTNIANIRSAASTARNAANEAKTCADRAARIRSKEGDQKTLVDTEPKVVSYYDQFMCQAYKQYSRDHNMAIIRYLYNQQYVDDITYDNTGHINGQGNTPIKEMLFGRAHAGDTSCETIMVYNVLNDLGVSTTLADIIFAADVNGYMLLGGSWGVAPYYVDDLMSLYGIQYAETTAEEVNEKLQSGEYEAGQPFAAVIWTDTPWASAIHTFEIVYAPEGESDWIVYNRFNDDKVAREYTSLSSILNNGAQTGSFIYLYQIDGFGE